MQRTLDAGASSISESSCTMCDHANIFLTSKFSYLLFLHLTHIKLKLGLQVQLGERFLIANHLQQSLLLTNQKQGIVVGSYFLHYSLAGVRLCCAFTRLNKLCVKMLGQKPELCVQVSIIIYTTCKTRVNVNHLHLHIRTFYTHVIIVYYFILFYFHSHLHQPSFNIG